MIDLGHGRIYLTENEPMPFGCPQCDSPVPYTQKQVVRCQTCGFCADRNEFLDVAWRAAEIN